MTANDELLLTKVDCIAYLEIMRVTAYALSAIRWIFCCHYEVMGKVTVAAS